MKTPRRLDALMDALRALPGVGPKTAQRYAVHLLQHDREGARAIAQSLSDALDSLGRCRRCNTFSEGDICETCASPQRDHAKLCVVESPADQQVVEHTLAFDGLYFVLMGRLSPLDGIGPGEIHFDELLARAGEPEVREVILATNFTPEGEATAHYLAEALRPKGISVTRLARGVPLGGELEYVDAATVAQAFRDRRRA